MLFGKRHKTPLGVRNLYTLALAELCRVTRVGGIVVALTTHKNLLSEVVEKEARWLPVARHELSMGQMMAYAVIVRRREADRDVVLSEPEPVGCALK